MKDQIVFYTFLIGFFGFFLGLGVFLGIDLVRDVEKGRESVGWPTVSGEVIDVFRSGNRPGVEYRYVVEGRTYVSRRVAFVRARTVQRGRGVAVYYGRDFSEGEMVPVYYNAANPEEAVLLPGAPRSGILVRSIAMTFLILVGGGGLWAGLRYSIKQKRAV